MKRLSHRHITLRDTTYCHVTYWTPPQRIDMKTFTRVPESVEFHEFLLQDEAQAEMLHACLKVLTAYWFEQQIDWEMPKIGGTARATLSDRFFCCPGCGMTSYNRHDAEMRYCGRCHSFWSPIDCQLFEAEHADTP